MTKQSIKDKWIIGWDYAHYGDYSVFDGNGKKWSTLEIKKHCYEVIKQLLLDNHNDTIKRAKELLGEI